MKKVLVILCLLGFLFRSSHSQATLFDGWISFSCNYLSDNIYEYSYQWGASTTLSQEEIDNLFLYESGSYQRAQTGIGTYDFEFYINWINPVNILPEFMSSEHSCISNNSANPLGFESVIGLGDVIGPGMGHDSWKIKREFTFRTKGYTGKQNIGLNVDYFALYYLLPEYSGKDRPYFCDLAGTPLQLTGNFTPIPEPGTLLLLGSGLLGLVGFTRFRSKKKS